MSDRTGWSGGRAGPLETQDRTGRAARALLLGLLVLAPAAVGLLAHNQLATRQVAVDAAWAQVESNLQRRADLLPPLVESVKRYMRHESELLTGVTRERAAAPQVQALAALERASAAQPAGPAAAAPDAAHLKALARHEGELRQGIRAVLAVAERYPALRSADQFLALQAQLEGSENRINVARMAFNDAVRDYNAALRALPTRWIAEAQNLGPRAYFEADPAARIARPLDFE